VKQKQFEFQIRVAFAFLPKTHFMKKKLFITTMIMLLCVDLWSQSKPVSVVFDVTSKDTVTQQTAIHHLALMTATYPNTKFEVVVYGGALPMVLKDKSTISKDLKQLEGNKNVSVKVCAVTMKRNNVDKTNLLPGVEVVPDGIMEIVNKQTEGWGYIKESHN
jgi:intracellular sulfur oxidation DsrE/DsrF family protein